MKRLLPIITCMAVLGIGVYVEYQANRPPDVPLIQADPRVSQDHAQAPRQEGSGKHDITIDIVELMDALDQLRGDDHADQLADWALYGTLLQAGLSSDEIRSAIFDIAPIRHPSLEDVLDFDYGPGRRALLPDGEVWLFYSERDVTPKATLARLADRVRMELGTIPDKFEIFRYRTELVQGAIHVAHEEPLPSSQLFSLAYGYVEQEVSTKNEFGDWLSQIDDVTFVQHNGDGSIKFGGRRLSESITGNLDLEDVAALFQAHSAIERSFQEIESLIDKEVDPVINAFDRLVNIYNREGRKSQYGTISTSSFEFASAERRLRHLLGDISEGSSSLFLPSELIQGLSPSGNPPDYKIQDPINQFLRSQKFKDHYAQRSAIDSLRPRVEKRIKEIQSQLYAELSLAGRVPPGEPGFSLDPQWDAQALVQDLQILAENTHLIIAPALDLAAALDDGASLNFDKAPRAIHATVMDLRSELEHAGSGGYRISSKRRAALSNIVQSVQGKSGKELEDGGILPFLEFKKTLNGSTESDDMPLLSILNYMEAKHRRQCARYDGPLSGTRVGMNLFYTDLLAKLWASLDYYREAPSTAIYGFRSNQSEGPLIEPAYWKEIWDLPSTRLWFGTRPGGYKGAPDSDDGLRFAHIGARVYAAGSDPLKPGKETTPSERSRRVMGWWDRHYAKVADYEQQYHVQNQILKWSVITGWMAEKGVLAGLESVAVDRSLRFDRWYAQNENLRFKHPIPFLPVNNWQGGNECIETLQSYTFQMAGTHSAIIKGGVTLGSSRSLGKATKISTKIPRSLRRSGLDYSKPGLQNIQGTIFELPQATRGKALVRLKFAKEARLRAMGTEYPAQSLSTSVSQKGATGSLRLRMDTGDFGVLGFQRTTNGVRLVWDEGGLVADAKALQYLGKSFFAKEPIKSLMTTTETLSPIRGDYILQISGKGTEVLRTSGGGLGGGGPPSARILRLAGNSPERRGNSFLQAATAPESDSSLAMLYKLVGSRVRARPIEAATLPLDDAMARVNQASWQRLHALPTDKSSPGVVGRIFTDIGPNQNAKSVFIQTGHPRLKKIKAFVQDDALYIKRPTNVEASKAFNDFVLKHRVTGEHVEKAVAAAATGDAQATVPLGLSAGRRHGMKAGEWMAQGKYDKAVAELQAAAKSKSLGEAVKGYQETSPRELAARLIRGEKTSSGSSFIKAKGFESNPDLMLASVLSDIRASQPQKAAQGLKSLPSGIRISSLSKSVQNRMSTVAMKSGRDYINARAGKFEGLSEAMSSRIDLRSEGFRIHTSISKKALKIEEKLNRQERIDIALLFEKEPPKAVYTQDQRILNKFDWDGAPESSLQKAMLDPRFVWKKLSTEKIGEFRPSVLMEDNVPFFKRPMPKLRSQTTSLQKNGIARGGLGNRYIYTVQSCDIDGDGTITKEEQKKCG